MKECCKTGDEKPPSRLKKIAIQTVWLVVFAIVLAVAIIQLFKF